MRGLLDSMAGCSEATRLEEKNRAVKLKGCGETKLLWNSVAQKHKNEETFDVHVLQQ